MLLDLTESFMLTYRHVYPPISSHPASLCQWDSTAPVHTTPFGMRTLSMLVFGVNAYAVLNLPFVFASLVALLLGVGQPEDWPDMFGDWSDAYTVRRFWGYVRRASSQSESSILIAAANPIPLTDRRTWHQTLRRVSIPFHCLKFLVEAVFVSCVPNRV